MIWRRPSRASGRLRGAFNSGLLRPRGEGNRTSGTRNTRTRNREEISKEQLKEMQDNLDLTKGRWSSWLQQRSVNELTRTAHRVPWPDLPAHPEPKSTIQYLEYSSSIYFIYEPQNIRKIYPSISVIQLSQADMTTINAALHPPRCALKRHGNSRSQRREYVSTFDH